jgi:hypothetical protein
MRWTEEMLAAHHARQRDAPQRCLTATLPLRTISEANVSQREHWAVKHKRHQWQRGQTRLILRAEWGKLMTNWQTPALITLTRIAPRTLDEGDNLAMSMKSIRDGVADWMGTQDNDPLLTWKYAQERGTKPREYAVRITVED